MIRIELPNPLLIELTEERLAGFRNLGCQYIHIEKKSEIGLVLYGLTLKDCHDIKKYMVAIEENNEATMFKGLMMDLPKYMSDEEMAEIRARFPFLK